MDDTKTYSPLIPFCLVITAYDRLFKSYLKGLKMSGEHLEME